MTVDKLEKLKELKYHWLEMVYHFADAMAIMEALGDDYEIEQIKISGGCAGILRFRSQLNNYCDYYNRKYLMALDKALEGKIAEEEIKK